MWEATTLASCRSPPVARLTFNWSRPPSAVAQDYAGLSARLIATNRVAAEKIKGITQRVAESRSWKRGRVSAQDSPSKQPSTVRSAAPRTDLTIETGAVEIKLSVSPYWTSARRKDGTPSLFNIFASVGLTDALVRKGLVISQDRTKTTRRRGFSYQTSTNYVPFSGNSWLESWALRADKGKQIWRHKVRIESPILLERLVLKPALEATKDRGYRLWANLIEGEFGRA